MTALALFEGPAWLLAKFYEISNNYIIAISMIAFVVMLITAPLQLKATKGMLEMQKLQPELRKLQNEHRGDRTKLNEEMMKLYQEHKVNPLASCFPLLLQFPVFIIMFQVLHGLTASIEGRDGYPGFTPKYLSESSELYQSLVGQNEMMAWGLDLAKRPIEMIGQSFGEGLIYALLVIALGGLYFVQQRMVAARASVSPTMSASQQKIMQYLPVVFAVFLVFYLTGLVVYYMAQAIFRIGLQYYITRRFYKGEHSLGQQAQRAGEKAREISKADGGGGGLFAQAKRDLAGAKDAPAGKGKSASGGKGDTNGRPASTTVSKRVTPPKNTPTPSSKGGRPPSSGKASSGKAGRPTPPAPRDQKKK
jgi:YidC/Oxa1 family membrane protein insertase